LICSAEQKVTSGCSNAKLLMVYVKEENQITLPVDMYL